MCVLLLLLFWVPCSDSLIGQNVCKRYKSAIDVTGNKVNVLEDFCCQGFKEQNDRCVECKECAIDVECPVGFCGKGCIQTCDCPNLSTCHPKHCCVCNAGFTGTHCNQSCPDGYFGENCEQMCACSKHAKCNAVTGVCLCDDGWTGDDCSKVIADTHNSTCTENCNCSEPICNVDTEECQCHFNDTYKDNISTDYTVNDSAHRQQSNSFTVLVLSASVAFVFVIILFTAALVGLRRSKRYQLTVEETIDDGHYDEINPYNEISEEDLIRLRTPYYSSPNDTTGINRTRSLPYIKPPCNIVTVLVECVEPEMNFSEKHKYLSLPNLHAEVIPFNDYTELKNYKESRSYQKLKTGSTENRNASGYLHPYTGLHSSQVLRSGYLHPYSTVKSIKSPDLDIIQSSKRKSDDNIELELKCTPQCQSELDKE